MAQRPQPPLDTSPMGKQVKKSISSLANVVMQTLRQTPYIGYASIISSQSAVAIALNSVEASRNPENLANSLQQNADASLQLISMLIHGRQAVLDAGRAATIGLPEMASADETKRRNRVVIDASRAKLCGYDLAIIYLHCLLTNDRETWQRIFPLMTASNSQGVLNGWAFYIKTSFVPGPENSDPLRMGK